jgi:hypothetical protein
MDESGNTSVNGSDDYVIYSDGSRHQIELLEDEDQ